MTENQLSPPERGQHWIDVWIAKDYIKREEVDLYPSLACEPGWLWSQNYNK